MNYKQFVDAMITCVRDRLSGEAAVDRHEILRNNGVTGIGISIRIYGKNAAPIIYLEEYYQKYCLGADLYSLSEHLIQKSREIVSVPEWDYENILDFQKIRDRIVYKLVNAKRNQKLLQEVPHLPVFDLAIVFYLLISAEGKDCCSILIRNTHMDYWKIPLSFLYQCAKENTPKLCPAVFRPLSELVEECFGENLPECPLYVLSNQIEANGASSILYQNLPKQIYESVGKNYYLLPSSIHEFLILPDDGMRIPAELKEIVYHMNEEHIAQEEVLSDSIYYFDGDNITEM